MDARFIRNFSVIAHIDHGKSTLADRFLELTGALQAREMEAQVLDAMDLERERGITIKAHPVRLNYTTKAGEQYVLNLIDTPGHVDFSYEVTRSLAACEGALLLVDASQGVEAQTLANAYLAVEDNLEIIPVINKIDLPGAQPEEARRQISDIIGLDGDHAILASAKVGTGVPEILEAIVSRLPQPKGDPDAPLKALIFDSWYDPYRGVVIVVRVIDGTLEPGMKIRLMAEGQDYESLQVGVFSPKPVEVGELGVGEVGFLVANIKKISDAKIGDTITESARPTSEPFPGFKELKPMVFAGLYPVEGHEYSELRDALEKLRLNDASFFYEPETSVALGFGFRCGFLGLLHMEIVQERLEREFDVDLVTTAPGVLYRVTTTDEEVHEIDSPAKLPDAGRIKTIEEPVITAMIMTPAEHVGAILQLCQDKRGVQKKLEYMASDRVLITYELPFNEVVLDFYDKLKTLSRGYASLDYHVTGYWASPLVKLDILVNGDPVDALSIIVHRDM
ncbi:MAG TPA: translation elongation factor 4, partial [Vicinamibacterales bacterium]